MPHKWYQGKTGVVWNVTKRAIGVEINKRVRLAWSKQVEPFVSFPTRPAFSF